MRIIQIIVILLFPFAGNTQQTDLVLLAGNIEIISYHQGGAQLPYEFTLPKPYATTIAIVEYLDSLTIPKFVKSVESDLNGQFEVYLPRGKYGFVTIGDLNKLARGQVLPAAFNTRDEHIYTNSYWYTEERLPLDLTQAESGMISLIYNNSSSCMDCP